MANKTISFRIFHNDQLVDTRSFTRDVIKLGRLSSSHIQLEDLAVGRMHAVIEVGSGGHVRVVDLGSTSGTRLNGEAVSGGQALRSGDSLAVGPYRLELAIGEAAPARAAAAPQAVTRSGPQAHPSTAAPAVDLATVEDEGEVAEVITSYGRSILDVSHVGQTRSRTQSALPLLALGGLFMVGGLGLFGYEVAQPWDAHAEAVAEAQEHHREAPEAPGLGTGSLGMGLALLGLVPFVGGLMRRRDESLDVFRIGEGSEANFKVPGHDLPDPGATTLVSRTADGYALAFTPSMRGSVALGDSELSLRDLVESGRARSLAGSYHYALPSGARAKLEHGDVRFSVNLVKRGAVVAGRAQVDWPFWGYFGGTATIATAFYMLMRSMPDDALAVQLADEEAAARFATYFHQADQQDEAEPVKQNQEPVSEDEPMGGETGQRASGAEGKMGDRSSSNSSGHYKMKGPADAVPSLARNYDPVASASRAGILGMLAAQDQHFLASPHGGAFAVGQDDEDVWGNLVGVEAAAAYGVGGLGLLGDGSGGGGANNLIGMGDVGLLGNGNGENGHYVARGDGGVTGFGEHKNKTPAPRVGKGTVKGAIDKDMIRRIVRAHINEVRSCYNQGLSKNPNLQGRVSIQFSIVGNGKVGSSVVQSNTTKDSAVAGCIARAVKRWKFPRVQNGGTALVTYPFMLEAR